MPKHKIPDLFYLIIIDRDKGVFNVLGPLSDDTSWNKKAAELQAKGRHIGCDVANKDLTKDQVIQKITMQLNLNYIDTPIL